MRRSYSRDDVQTHSDSFRPSRPAVNVKIYDSFEDVKLPLCLGGVANADGSDFHWVYTEDAYTHEWVRENVNDQTFDSYFWDACSDGVGMIQEEAREIFGNVEVYQEGRSGGWIVVDGIPDIEDWDAVQLAKWRRFEKITRAYADDVMRSCVTSIYMNAYEWQTTKPKNRHAPLVKTSQPWRSNDMDDTSKDGTKVRLEYLRSQLDAERISYAELAELQDLAEYIEPGDVQLLEAAGVPENPPDAWEMLEADAPNGCEAVQDLYSWSLNYDAGRGPFTLFVDLIGWSEEQLGEPIYSLRDASLGYLELGKLADALAEYVHDPHGVRDYVDKLIEAESRG
jgi:hypothetical protein